MNKPDGSLCFKFVVALALPDQSCASVNYDLTFTNGAGEVVATGTQHDQTITVQCAGTSEMVTCGPTPACNTGLWLFGSTNCPEAICRPGD